MKTERVRLAILGNASITKRKPFAYGWRNLLSGLGFFLFILLAIQIGFGYHLLPATALFGFAIFACAKLLPENKFNAPDRC